MRPSRYHRSPALDITTGVLGVFGVVGGWLLFVSLPWPLIHDAPIIHYIAWRIAGGAVPYRDLFDMNQPGAYLIHLGVVQILGDGDLAWRLVDLAWLGAAAAALYAFARPWGPGAAGGAALLFAVYHLAGGAWQAGQRDFLAVPLLLAGALGVARWLEAALPARLPLLMSGLAVGAAVTIKPHAIILALALGLAAGYAGRGPGRLGGMAVYAASVLAAPAGVLLWLASAGALRAWWDIVTRYLVPFYSRLTRPEDWHVYRWHVWIPIAAAILISLASLAAARRLTARHAIALLGAGYGVLHFVVQGKGWEYHLYPLAAFASLLVFSELPALLRARALPLAIPLVVSLLAIAILLGAKGAATADAAWIWDKERAVRLLVHDLEQRLRPGDTVQVLDTTEGGIHALLRLRRIQPTRFLYDFHFHHDVEAPAIQGLRAELADALAARPPRVVVVFERGWPRGGYERLAELPDVARWLAEHYVAVTRRPGYVVLAHRDRP